VIYEPVIEQFTVGEGEKALQDLRVLGK